MLHRLLLIKAVRPRCYELDRLSRCKNDERALRFLDIAIPANPGITSNQDAGSGATAGASAGTGPVLSDDEILSGNTAERGSSSSVALPCKRSSLRSSLWSHMVGPAGVAVAQSCGAARPTNIALASKINPLVGGEFANVHPGRLPPALLFAEKE